MPTPVPRHLVRATIFSAVAVGLILAGRLSAGAGPTDAYRSGYDAGRASGYLAGLGAGTVQGREEGRALQAGSTVPAASRQPVRDAFMSGYAAGADDIFTGYDGGWALSEPYVITLVRATAPITYRIGSRTPMVAGVRYLVCGSGEGVCEEPVSPAS